MPQKKVSKVQQATPNKFWQSQYFNQWLVFGLAFVLYAGIIGGGYNMDDELVTQNHRLTSKGISAIPEIFTSPYYQDESGYSYEYRPLVLVSFAIEHQVFGDNAHVSHFFNALLYALCCMVLFLVLRKLFKNYSPLLALAVSLLFMVHPAHTEVVCSIKNRDEILGLIFALLTLLVSLKGIETGRKWWFVLAPVFFMLALMGKITVISFVVIIPIALILFTAAGWILISLLTISLFIPSYFLLDLNSGSMKLMLFAGALMGVIIFYAINNFESFKVGAAMFFKRVRYSLFTGGPVIVTNTGTGEPSYSPKELFKGINPGKYLFAMVPIVVTVPLVVFYLVLLALNHPMFAILPVGLLILLAWLGEESMSWWAMVMVWFSISACIGANPSCTAEGMMNLYSRLVGFYFAFQLYYGKRTLFIPGLLLFAFFNFCSIYFGKNYDALFFPLVIFFNNSYIRYFVFVVLFFWSKDLFPFKNKYDLFELIGNVTAMLMLIFIHFKKGMRIVPWALLICAVTWFHYNQRANNRPVSVKNAVMAVKYASDQINPKVIAEPQNRPLNFIEECVDITTPRITRIGTSFEILFHYLVKVVVPYPLSYYYGYKFITLQKMTGTLPLISLTLHLLLLLAALFFLKREPLLSFGLLVYLVSVVVFSNYLQPVPGMFGDRFLLIPSIGWSIVLVVVLQKIFRADLSLKALSWLSLSKYARYAFVSVLLVYGGLTLARSIDWYSDLRLMRHDIKVVPESVQANNLLGIHLVKASLVSADANEQVQLRNEALQHLKTANALYPGYFNFIYDIARVYSLLNMPDSALVYFKQAIDLNPDFTDVPLNIANIYFSRNDFENSIPYFIRLISKNPNDFTFFDKLSFAYYRTNQFDLSVKTNLEAIKRLPGRVDPFINIATCYLNRTDMKTTVGHDSAVVWLNRALIASPDNQAIKDYLKKIK